MKKSMVVFALLVVVFLSSCATGPKVYSVSGDEDFFVQESAFFHPRSPFRFAVGDKFEVRFGYKKILNPTLDIPNQTVIVDDNGYAKFNLVGSARVAGSTIQRIDSLLAKWYQPFFVGELDVNIIVRELGTREVYVAGAVKEPGAVELSRDMTVLRAIVSTGGPTEKARMDNVVLVYIDGEGDWRVSLLDLTPARLELLMQNDRKLGFCDLVYVPDEKIGNMDEVQLLQYVLGMDLPDRWRWYASMVGK